MKKKDDMDFVLFCFVLLFLKGPKGGKGDKGEQVVIPLSNVV